MPTPTTVKSTVTSHTTELSMSIPAGYTKARIINRTPNVQHWSFNQGVVTKGGNTVPAGQVLVIDVPPLGATLYYMGYVLGHTFEIECFK